MKKFLLLVNVIVVFIFSAYAQNNSSSSISLEEKKISPYLIGQNVWERSGVFKVKEQIKDVSFQTIRIGGNGYENAGFMNNEVVKFIDYARSVGAEPIVQMPRQFKDSDKAYQAIAYLNGKMGKNIKFWSIGNEPDHKNQYSSPEGVFEYFTKISEQIKRYDPAATIIGFDLASYKASYLNRLLGGDLDVTGKIPGTEVYYLDILSFHNYKFTNISGFEADVKDLKAKIQKFNLNRPANHQLTWAITEFNSHWLVDPKLDEDYLPYTFHNGQIFAEMYDLGMREGAFTIAPWSILEGGADREGTDLSLFDLVNEKYYPRSNYYHTMLLAQNFRNNYLAHQDNQKDIVVIPMGDKKGFSIMILNKNKSTGFKYTLQLNYKEVLAKDLTININANINKSIKGTIEPFSTQMLVLNANGKILKKYNYSAKDADTKEAPHLER